MDFETMGCLTGCGRAAHTRGLCDTCKGRQDRAVAEGETTEAELIARGLRAAPKRSWQWGGDLKVRRA
jgi:hypothetical protein